MKFKFPEASTMKKLALYGVGTAAVGACFGITYFGYLAQVPAAAFTVAQTHAAATFGNSIVGTYASISSFTVNQFALASAYGTVFAATCLAGFKVVESDIESYVSRKIREIGAPDLAELVVTKRAEHVARKQAEIEQLAFEELEARRLAQEEAEHNAKHDADLPNETTPQLPAQKKAAVMNGAMAILKAKAELRNIAKKQKSAELAKQQPSQESAEYQHVKELARLQTEKVTRRLQKRALELAEQQSAEPTMPLQPKKTIQELFEAFITQRELKVAAVLEQPKPVEFTQQKADALQALGAALVVDKAASKVLTQQEYPSQAVQQQAFQALEAELAQQEVAPREQEQPAPPVSPAYTPSIIAARPSSPKKCRAFMGLDLDNVLPEGTKRNRNQG